MSRWDGPYSKALDAETLDYALRMRFNEPWTSYLSREQVEAAFGAQSEVQCAIEAAFRWCPCLGPWCTESPCVGPWRVTAMCFPCACRAWGTERRAGDEW